MKWEHKAIRVQQQPGAAPFYILSVEAPEILQWADVPRKKSQYMAGYQRELDDRHKKLTEFFLQDPKNVVPGAIIIAIDADAISITGGADDVFTVSITHEEKTIEQLLDRTYKHFLDRLGESERKSLESIIARTGVDEPSDVEDESDAEEEDDATEPDSYLTLLTAELAQARNLGLGSLSNDRQQAISEYLSGIAKPGLILDGQHRVFAAKNVDDFVLNMPVVLMPGLETAEQVFHFYVLNNKAKPLKPTELRSTVSTSLSNKEIGSLYSRLRKSGVKSEEAQWTHLMNTSNQSPFKGLIDFGFTEGGGFIPENVAFQVASKFMKPPKKFRLLHDSVEAWSEEEYRLQLFFRFWGAIRKKYKEIWSLGAQRQASAKTPAQKQKDPLFFKATMICIQELVFEALVQEMPRRRMRKAESPFVDPDELANEVEASLYFLPPDFFTKEWTETGLDTPERRRFLILQMKEAINKQGERIGHLQLFRKK